MGMCVPQDGGVDGCCFLRRHATTLRRRSRDAQRFHSLPSVASPIPPSITFYRAHRHRRRRGSFAVAARQSEPGPQDVDVSVLRFTLGIPGFDESYLPRYIGLAAGSLIALNHFFSASSATPAQLRSEALGMVLAAFSATLPYLGRFLKGANPVDRTSIPEGNKQIFILSENLSVDMKEDLAWASYVLLRNTNTMSVLIAVKSQLCVRGYWNIPEDVSDDNLAEWFKSQTQQTGFLGLKDALYFPQSSDYKLEIILPNGALSVLVQPISGTEDQIASSATIADGFILLVSNSKYAYGEKDRAWVRAVSNKFRGMNAIEGFEGVEASFDTLKSL